MMDQEILHYLNNEILLFLHQENFQYKRDPSLEKKKVSYGMITFNRLKSIKVQIQILRRMEFHLEGQVKRMMTTLIH
jgi:uncharacterized protein YaaW (UPF0174 family)